MYRKIKVNSLIGLVGVPIIGDSKRDLEAAVSVGASPILVRTGKGQRSISAGGLPSEVTIHDDLMAAVQSLLLYKRSIV